MSDSGVAAEVRHEVVPQVGEVPRAGGDFEVSRRQSASHAERKVYPAHNPEVAGSNPAPATSEGAGQRPFLPSGREGLWRGGQRMVNMACRWTGADGAGFRRATDEEQMQSGPHRRLSPRDGCAGASGRWVGVATGISTPRQLRRGQPRRQDIASVENLRSTGVIAELAVTVSDTGAEHPPHEDLVLRCHMVDAERLGVSLEHLRPLRA